MYGILGVIAFLCFVSAGIMTAVCLIRRTGWFKTLVWIIAGLACFTVFISVVVKEEQKNISAGESSAVKISSVPIPDKVDDLPRYLENFLPRQAKDRIFTMNVPNDSSRYLIACDFNLTGGLGVNMKTRAMTYARDYISAAYNAIYQKNFPVAHVSIAIKKPNGQDLALSVGIGKNVADSQPKEVWSDSVMSPSAFLNWAKQSVNDTMDFTNRCIAMGEYKD